MNEALVRLPTRRSVSLAVALWLETVIHSGGSSPAAEAPNETATEMKFGNCTAFGCSEVQNASQCAHATRRHGDTLGFLTPPRVSVTVSRTVVLRRSRAALG